MNEKELTEYAEWLLQAAVYKCGNLQDAEDISQETLLCALYEIRQGRKIKNPKSWLMTVLDRKYYDMLRRKYRKPTVSIDAFDNIPDDFTEDDISDDAENIRHCVANLTKIYREVIILHYMHGKSVKDIAHRLGIPENTVKSRLSSGRQHIKKEFTMENYTKQSYEPDDLWISISGEVVMDGEPFSLVGSDRIAMNLLILAYDAPITVPELAKAIGISTTYIEPVVEKLISGELMKKVGDKIYTDFIIKTEEDRLSTLPLQKSLAERLCSDIWSVIDKGLNELRQQDFYKRHSNIQAIKLDSFFVMKTLIQSINSIRDEICGGSLPFEQYPDRPNGGKWFAMGSRYPHGYDYDNSPYALYNWSGETCCDTLDKLGAKRITICYFDTDKRALGHIPHEGGDGEYLGRLMYAVHIGRHEQLDMLDQKKLDRIDEFIGLGLFERDDSGELKLTVPVISMQDRWTVYKLCQKYANTIAQKHRGECAELFRHPIQLPKHLKSVPKWQTQMDNCCFFPMAVIMQAKKKGLFLKGCDSPAPAIMLCVETE